MNSHANPETKSDASEKDRAAGHDQPLGGDVSETWPNAKLTPDHAQSPRAPETETASGADTIVQDDRAGHD